MRSQTQIKDRHISEYISIFSQPDWEELDAVVNTILIKSPEIFEKPQRGDSRNEYVDLRVARFMRRENGRSEIVNNPYSLQILNILTRSNFIALVEKQTRLKNLDILRVQLNAMEKNSVIGIHTDQENDPAFEITALIRTTSAYSGGELCIYENKLETINQKNHTVFLMNSNLEHEVKTVLSGTRNSLIVLLGKKALKDNL